METEGRGAGGGLEGILTWAGGGGGVGVVITGVGVVTLRLFMLRSCGSSSDPAKHDNTFVNTEFVLKIKEIRCLTLEKVSKLINKLVRFTLWSVEILPKLRPN